MDDHKNLPTFIGKLKIDWLNFPVDDILQQFTTLKDGILRGMFKQQTARTWYGCRAEKAQVIVLLPVRQYCYSTWSDLVDCMPHSWPKSFNIGRMQISPITATSFHKLRKFTRARHIWLHLDPDWNLLWKQLCTEWPGIHTYDEILAETRISLTRKPRWGNNRRSTGSGWGKLTTCGNSRMSRFDLFKSK